MVVRGADEIILVSFGGAAAPGGGVPGGAAPGGDAPGGGVGTSLHADPDPRAGVVAPAGVEFPAEIAALNGHLEKLYRARERVKADDEALALRLRSEADRAATALARLAREDSDLAAALDRRLCQAADP